MKALLKSTLVIAAAAIAFASCQTEEINAPAEGRTVNFLAVSNDAKAAFSTPDGNTYPVLWTANDKDAKVSLNLADVKDATVTPADDFASATISCSAITDDNKGSYTFYAISPAKAWIGTSTAKKSFNLSIPAAQTPTATSVDEATMVLFGQTETLTEFPTDYVPMTFKHVAAYGLLSFANLNLDGATVTSVEISSSEDIAGRWNYFPEEDNVSVNSGVNAITITTASAEGIWFAIAPVDLTGKYVKFTVNTSKGTFTREFQAFTKGNFEAGKIAKFAVDMSGIAPVEGEKYILVKDASSLAVGDKVIIGAQAFNYAISTTQNSSNRAAAAVEKDEDGNIITAGSSVEIITLVKGSDDVAGSYGFMTTDGKYLYAAGATSSNKLGTTTTLNATASWTISVADDGVATIKCANTSVTRNTLQFNNGSASNLLFSCYSSASQKAVAIYKSNIVVPVEKDPEAIVLSAENISTNYPMEYISIARDGTPDEYGFGGEPNWVNPLPADKAEARLADLGKAENMWDGDDNTCFHTNMDWQVVNSSWGGRYSDDKTPHWIQITLPHPVSTLDLYLKNPTNGSAQKIDDKGFDILCSDYTGTFTKYGTYSNSGSGAETTIEGINTGSLIYAIRIQANRDGDWTGVAQAFGIGEIALTDAEPSSYDLTKAFAVSIDKGYVEIVSGNSTTLSATVFPSTATNKSVVWSSTDTSVATVANGVVTAVNPGEAVITATSIDCGYAVSCNVKVNELPEVSLSADLITTNDPMQYVVGGSDTYGFASNPNWFAAISEAQATARREKFGLAANMLDRDASTCFHTNIDWGQPGTSWGTREMPVGQWVARYIQVGFSEPLNKFKLWFQSSQEGKAAEGYKVLVSSDNTNFTEYTSFSSNTFGQEFNVNTIEGTAISAIRIQNTNENADWTCAANGFGIAEIKVWNLE